MQLHHRLTSLCLGWASPPRGRPTLSDLAIFPGFFSILCSVFRDSVVTIFREIS